MTGESVPVAALPVPLISVRGTPGECGAGYGSAAAGVIGHNVELYRRRFFDQARLDTGAVRAAGERFRSVTAGFHPRIAAMLDGVAEGAGVDVHELYALNARTELLYDARVPRARPASAPDGPDGGCTSVGALDTHTASGHLLLGQNWDWHPDQRDAMVLLATHDERGHRVLTLAEGGMLAKAGLNSAGVGVCVNMLGCDRDGLPRDGSAPGVPYHVLLRGVLEADSLSWALRTACRSPRNASINLLIGQAGGRPGALAVADPAASAAAGRDPAGGELIDLELVPGDAGWLHPTGGLLTHANHLEARLPVYDTAKDLGGSSLFRSARARRLLDRAAAEGAVTDKDLASVLRDHASYPLAICRHVDERDGPLDRSESVYSIIMDLDDCRFGLAAGPPCQHEYVWLDLDEVLPAGSAT